MGYSILKTLLNSTQEFNEAYMIEATLRLLCESYYNIDCKIPKEVHNAITHLLDASYRLSFTELTLKDDYESFTINLLDSDGNYIISGVPNKYIEDLDVLNKWRDKLLIDFVKVYG